MPTPSAPKNPLDSLTLCPHDVSQTAVALSTLENGGKAWLPILNDLVRERQDNKNSIILCVVNFERI